MDAVTTATTPILRPQRPLYGWVLESADTDSIGLIRELEALLTAENANGYTFQPSVYAYEHAKAYLNFLTRIAGRSLPKPELISDGEGGIEIEWEKSDKRLAISCRANPEQRDCIYWRQVGAGGYEARDLTAVRIVERLRWLVRA